MFILKIFWNLLSAVMLIAILAFAGYGVYNLIQDIQDKSTTNKPSQYVINLDENNEF